MSSYTSEVNSRWEEARKVKTPYIFEGIKKIRKCSQRISHASCLLPLTVMQDNLFP
jgi:hypothetical protein